MKYDQETEGNLKNKVFLTDYSASYVANDNPSTEFLFNFEIIYNLYTTKSSHKQFKLNKIFR